MMQKFYSMRGAQPCILKAYALRRAQPAMLNAQDARPEHPHYRALFILIGNSEMRRLSS